VERSTAKILTTHVGSLPWLTPLDKTMPDYEVRLREAVPAVVAKQKSIGLDIINEGEYAKGGDWLGYMEERFGGYDGRPPSGEKPLIQQGKDREDFADFYQYATERGILFFLPGGQMGGRRQVYVCTGPVSYRGTEALRQELELAKQNLKPYNSFMTSTAPASLEVYRRNEYYKSDEEYVFAIADAMKVEYAAIVKAGFILQVDDAWLPALWDRIGMKMGMKAFRKRCALRIEALNHALAGIPEDRVRYHLCWGSWHGPHAYDLEMIHIVDLMLKVKAEAFVIEAANARHEHEYVVWDQVKLPKGKILIPGVISHATDGIEHPELISQRIQRFAKLVGRENVIAGADCGFGGRSHPQIAWAKLEALVEGAKLASKALGFGARKKKAKPRKRHR
jgi:5-methyltetrahydropteroyltriglutamate--homocysteine methyltransferase